MRSIRRVLILRIGVSVSKSRIVKEPRAIHAPGSLQVVASVGSFDPGGGVSGDGVPPGSGLSIQILVTKPLRDYAADRAAFSTSRSLSAASSLQRFAIPSKNFRSSAFLVFEAYHLH